MIKIDLASTFSIHSLNIGLHYLTSHKLSSSPIKVLSRDGLYSSHFLEQAVLESFVHVIKILLVLSLILLDSLGDLSTGSCSDCELIDYFFQVDLNIAGLKVVVVDIYNTRKALGLRVTYPDSLPLASPKCSEVEVDARDLDPQLSFFEEYIRASGTRLVLSAYVLLNGGSDLIPVI